jgi:hypothetical protein
MSLNDAAEKCLYFLSLLLNRKRVQSVLSVFGEGPFLRWLEQKIDRFCSLHPRFGIPNLMLYIAVANMAIYLLDTFSLSIHISNYLYFSRELILKEWQIWRIFTFVLLPQSGDFLLRGTGLFFVAISAYFYYWIGSVIEREMGTARFTLFYLAGVFLNIICGFIVGGTSMHYINLSLFFSMAIFFPDTWIRLFYILPVKLKWIAWIDAALFIWDVLTSLLSFNLLGAVLPVIAIFNFILFFWSYFTQWLGYRKLRFQHQHSQQTVNFKKAASKAYQQKGYIHKCAVCGKTDTEYPDMEFRYCSKCNGYYCYCMEHINNHVHIE